jgi:hypothetical protein
MKKKTMRICTGEWIDKLVSSIGDYVVMRTTEGVERCGRISGFELRSFKFNGELVDIPSEIELNGDPYDRVPMDRLESIKIG